VIPKEESMQKRISALTIILAAVMGLSASSSARAKIHEEAVQYEYAGTVMKGHLYYDDATEGKRPGVLVVHEWWGLNEHAKRSARRLAEAGYVALAVDMYGEGKTTEHPEEAMAFATAARKDPEVTRARFEAGLAQLKSHPKVDAEKIAAIGYCFGGTVVLDMARGGMDLDGVVSFHGGLAAATPAEPGAIKAKILVCDGAEDPMNPLDTVKAFLEEMNGAGADFEFIAYGGAKHSFTNPDADKHGIPGLAYNAEADRRSWQAMLDFFDEIFGESR
jgi:dienelactone hydrolase